LIGSPTTPVRLLHVTDPHLFGDESRTIYGVRTAESFRQVLAEAVTSAGRPDAVVVTGDIAEDHAPEAYRNFRRALEPYGLPVYCLPGNHDEPAVMPALVGHSGFQYCGSASFGAWGSVFLDTHVRGRPEGRVERAEIDRLERELQQMHDRPVMVCLHHPPLPVGSAWLDAVGLVNADELFEVIDRHATVRLVLGGHVHQAFERRRGGALVLATPSTCAQFTPGTERCVMDLKPPGYRVLELAPDGGVRTEVRWLQGWSVDERPPDDRR
jgi:Icc protein